ncbi:MAG: hypothetical protein EOP84_11775, partial [Verrucomicrobiaceae bacterium]
MKLHEFPLASAVPNNSWPLMLGHPRSYPKSAANCLLRDFRSYASVTNATITSLTVGATIPESADIDGDGLDYATEYLAGGRPDEADTDLDTIDDGHEYFGVQGDIIYSTPFAPPHSYAYSADSDGDGLGDAEEKLGTVKSNPLSTDTDGDGLSDYDEVRYANTNPRVKDTDSDGMWDGWEYNSGISPTTPNANADPDQDNKSNLTEYNSNPQTNPLVNESKIGMLDLDSDGDGLDDYVEQYVFGTNKNDPESSVEGISDYDAIASGLKRPGIVGAIDPDADEDNDSISNKDEVENGTNPRDAINFTSSLFGAVPMKEVAELNRPKTKKDTGFMQHATRSVKIKAPDNGKYYIAKDKDAEDLGFSARLILSGKATNKAGEQTMTVTHHHRGFKGKKDTTKSMKGMSFESVHRLDEEIDISTFVNGLERDDEGYVTINCELQAPVTFQDKSEKQKDYEGLLYPFQGSPGSGNGAPPPIDIIDDWGDFSWKEVLSKVANVLKEVKEKEKTEESKELWGSTAIFLRGYGMDVDVTSATSDSTMDEDKEDLPGGVMGILSVGTGGKKSTATAKVRISQVGLQGASRQLTFDPQIIAVYKGGTRVANSPVTYTEAQGPIDLEVYAIELVAGQLPVVSTGLSVAVTASKPVPGDGVTVYTNEYRLEFDDQETLIPADEHEKLEMQNPFKTYIADVYIMSYDEEEEVYGWKMAEDGSEVEFSNMMGSGLRTAKSYAATKKTRGGTAIYTAEYWKQLDSPEDVYRINAKLKSVKVGTTDIAITGASKTNGLLYESEKAIVLPGAPRYLELSKPPNHATI